jgi:hypothetical protein
MLKTIPTHVILDYIKKNAAHIEFGLHGVRHEFWDAETHRPTRADWAYHLDLLGNLVLKHKLLEGEHISSASLNGGNIACHSEERRFFLVR